MINFIHELEEIVEVIQREISNGVIIYPYLHQIMRPFYETPLNNVRIVIMGQEPYYNHGQANGLAFSVDKGVAIPPSLNNIFKEISETVEGFVMPSHGNLSSWCKQGVLLINTSLTVEYHNHFLLDPLLSEPRFQGRKKRSHEALWKGFIRRTIKLCSEKGNVIFLLLGKEAGYFDKDIDTSKNTIFKSSHPSPYSVNRGFSGCGYFKMINDLLKEDAINWNI